MSFEGYYMVLCEDGHLSSYDVYDYSATKCFCGKKFVWWDLIDCTNGCDEEDIPDLEVLEEAKLCECCGNIKEPVRYKIPEEGHKGNPFDLAKDWD